MVASGLCPHYRQAAKGFDCGGIYVNNVRESSLQRSVSPADPLFGENLRLRKGTKNYTLVTVK